MEVSEWSSHTARILNSRCHFANHRADPSRPLDLHNTVSLFGSYTCLVSLLWRHSDPLALLLCQQSGICWHTVDLKMIKEEEEPYLQITMNDLHIMKHFKTTSRLDEYFPNVILINEFLVFLTLLDQLEYVASICIFHYDTIINMKLKVSYHSMPLASSKKASL